MEWEEVLCTVRLSVESARAHEDSEKTWDASDCALDAASLVGDQKDMSALMSISERLSNEHVGIGCVIVSCGVVTPFSPS